jgi:hypothetical protein
VGDLFDTWDNEPLRPITFDPQTRLALRQWLRRTLSEIALTDSPNVDALSAMNAVRDARIDTSGFFRNRP